MPNRLGGESSPYLLQHADNPVDWYPWGPEAFARARAEDKPVFLSIGYSSCHWCHVMARESFEDGETAALLNRHFIPIKVDREERPDIDSVYMAFCQAFTGQGGWPCSVFMTPEQAPFFAGTYFPKARRGGLPGFKELLLAIRQAWEGDRAALLDSAAGALEALKAMEPGPGSPGGAGEALIQRALEQYAQSYDREWGGFGQAPKFPAAHKLLFLLSRYERAGDREALAMAENTLVQMYRGGLFDHIGGGFCRYSTDRRFLVPHFEKMLYDNALLILAYARAYWATGKELYLLAAERTAAFAEAELRDPAGGFYSALDADSQGEEGKFYLFAPEETRALLGQEAGEAFNRAYDIRPGGNFQGKSIPNLLKTREAPRELDPCLPKLCAYRKGRFALGLDDKVLTAWNGLMIAALCELYRASGRRRYLLAAEEAAAFIEKNLAEGEALYASFRRGRRGQGGVFGGLWGLYIRPPGPSRGQPGGGLPGAGPQAVPQGGGKLLPPGGGGLLPLWPGGGAAGPPAQGEL